MDEKNNDKNGMGLFDFLDKRPMKALIYILVLLGGIFWLAKAGIFIKTPIFESSPSETQNPKTPTTDPVKEEKGTEIKKEKWQNKEEPLPVTRNVEPNLSHSQPLFERGEQKERIIEGSLDFQTPSSSDYYFIKVQGKGGFQRVEKSGDFKIFVDPTETVVHIDVFNQAKEKITSKNIDATTSNTIQIIIK